MARPKSALRKKLEEVANAHAALAAANANVEASSLSSATATTGEPSSSGSPAYTETTNGAATPSSTSTWHTSDEEERNRIAAELERLSVLGPEQVNRRNFSLESAEWKEMMDSVSPDFSAYWDNYPRALTFAENISGSRDMADQDPMYAIHVEEISADVDLMRGTASVMMQLRVTTTNVTYQGMSTLEWERNGEGKWLCLKHIGYRALNAGFD